MTSVPSRGRNQTTPGIPRPPQAGQDVARAVGAVAVAGVGLIHFLLLSDAFKDITYLGVLFLALILGSLWAAHRLIRVGDTWGWLMAGGLAVATLIAYIVSRTFGLPAFTEDIGNWTEPLGLTSVFVEAMLTLLSLETLLKAQTDTALTPTK
jgi:Kef-type K+ transport system membrane component KefB